MWRAIVNTAGSKLQSKVSEMRRLFDTSFAAPAQEHVKKIEQMLAITVEGERFAVRVLEISGVAMNKGKIVPVPSSVPEFLGLMGVRGTVVPVFSLAALLGFHSEAGQTRWLVFCGGKQASMALAFDEMEHQFEIPASEIFSREGDRTRRYVDATARDGAGLRGVISIVPLVEHMMARGRLTPTK
jgi:chemotaxis signal transduction protein